MPLFSLLTLLRLVWKDLLPIRCLVNRRPIKTLHWLGIEPGYDFWFLFSSPSWLLQFPFSLIVFPVAIILIFMYSPDSLGFFSVFLFLHVNINKVYFFTSSQTVVFLKVKLYNIGCQGHGFYWDNRAVRHCAYFK